MNAEDLIAALYDGLEPVDMQAWLSLDEFLQELREEGLQPRKNQG